MRETTYKDTGHNILRQARLIEDMVRKKKELERSLLGESEKLSEILLNAVDKGEIHIVDAYAFWSEHNDHLPIQRWIDSDFLTTHNRNLDIERRQRVIYSEWLVVEAPVPLPPLAESKWESVINGEQNSYFLGRVFWGSLKDGGLDYEGIFAMMHKLIANGQKGFICDW